MNDKSSDVGDVQLMRCRATRLGKVYVLGLYMVDEWSHHVCSLFPSLLMKKKSLYSEVTNVYTFRSRL